MMILTRVRALALACLLACAPAMVLAQTQPAPTAKQGTSNIPRDTTPTSIFVAPAGGGYGPGRVVAIDQGFPVECLAGCSSPVAFTPSGAASLTAGTSSTRVALPAGATVLLINNGSVDLYYKPGNSGVVATTSDFLLPAGRAIVIAAGANTHVAGITAASTAQLSVTTGSGSPTISGGGGGSGGGGAVTIADGADVAQGDRDDAAWSGTGSGTSIAIQKAIRNLLAGPQGTFGAITAYRSVIYDSSGAEIDFSADVPTINGATPFNVTVNTALPAGANTIGSVNLGTIGAAATAAKQPALGTLGTPSADVITVQGGTGGTPLPIVASVAQATPIGTVAGQPIMCRAESTSTSWTDDQLNIPICATWGGFRVGVGDANGIASTSNAITSGFATNSRVLLTGALLTAKGATNYDPVNLYPQSFSANTNALAVGIVPNNGQVISTNTSTDAIKTGAGAFKGVCIGVAGAGGNVATVYDNTTATGTVIATIDLTTSRCLDGYNRRFTTGLSVLTATGTPANFTVLFD